MKGVICVATAWLLIKDSIISFGAGVLFTLAAGGYVWYRYVRKG
jgi:hypothetical protein